MAETGAGVKDADGAPVIAVDGKGEGLVLGVSVVAAAGGGSGEGTTLDVGVSVGVRDAAGGKDGVPVRGGPAAAAVVGKGDTPAVKEAITVKGKGKVKKDEEGVKWLKHYSSMQSILIVGDGDFSFSLALATAFGSGKNLVATSVDSYENLIGMYSKAKLNVMKLKRLGATVLHDVDAEMMRLQTDLETRRFDRIVFNFPHAGFHGKEYQVHMIKHKKLVSGFFGNARHLLRPCGETHVSHKTGHPYDAWDIKQLAYESSLIVVDVVEFHKEDYPGYHQKRGHKNKCDQPFNLGRCCTFKFCIGDVKKLKKVCGNRIGSISSFGDSDDYPGALAIDRRPLDLLPLTPAWSWPFHPVNTALEPYHHGVTQREHPYIHHEDALGPMFTLPLLAPNVLPTGCGIPSMRRITNMPFPEPPEQPWHQERPSVDPLQRGSDYFHIAWEHQSRLHREYDIRRRAMPRGTSLDYSNFLEDCYRRSVEKRMHLERLIARYSGP